MTRITSAWLWTAVSLVTTGLLWPQSGAAQTDADTLASLRACGTVTGDRDRLACFDRALASERAEPLALEHAELRAEPVEPPVAERAEPPAVERAEPPVAERAESRAAAPAELRAAATAEPSSSSSVGDAQSVPSANATAVQAANAPAARVKDDRADQPRAVRIVDVNATVSGAARFLTSTGQLIIQTSGGTPRGGYPDVPFDATLEGGALGSLFLAVDERRRVRVRLSD